mgnify:FL=1
MSNSKRTNGKYEVKDVLLYILFMALITLGGMSILGVLDIAGAMVHTAFSAAFSNGNVVNYVSQKKEQIYFAHTFLRALIAAFALMHWWCNCDDRALQSFGVRMIIFMLVLAGVDFLAYAVEFLGIAFWRAITSGFHDIQIMNVIKLRYLDHIDVFARVGQAFVAANVWYLYKRARTRWERRRRARRQARDRRG